MPEILDQLGKKHGTDKASGSHNYLDFYQLHLARLRDFPVKVLEIGVGDGHSLRMWRDYFPLGQIIGFDIQEDRRQCAGDRIEIVIGDQGKREDLERLVSERGAFDLVVDDGGHREEDQILSYRILIPAIRDGGVYILEDASGSAAVEFVLKIADGIIKGHDNEGLSGMCESIAFYRETSVTKRRGHSALSPEDTRLNLVRQRYADEFEALSQRAKQELSR